MKQIGLLCGLSWVSTIEYYKNINLIIADSLGRQNSAKIFMNSLNAEFVYSLLSAKKTSILEKYLIQETKKLENAGANFIGITCNTVHDFFDAIQNALSIPIIHILSPVVDYLQQNKIKKVGILGTKHTMKSDNYRNFLLHNEISPIFPSEYDMTKLNEIIYNYCAEQKTPPGSIKILKNIINSLIKQDVDTVILGCTELGVILKKYESNITILDTTTLHSKKLGMLSLELNNSINFLKEQKIFA